MLGMDVSASGEKSTFLVGVLTAGMEEMGEM